MSERAPDSPGDTRRPGRIRILAILILAFIALAISIIGISTREPGNEFRGVSGVDDTQRIFGGEFQRGERLGQGNAQVQIQVFTDVQAAGFSSWFDQVIPALVDGPVRDGSTQLLLRNRSLTRNPTELSFFGIEAAAEQDYAWNYAYLVSRNLDLARDVGLGDDFLQTIAESIERMELAIWKSDYEASIESDSEVMQRLEEQDKLAIGLELRAEPALVITGPGGTEILQDAPDLAEIEATIGEVR
ncbi:MAG: hypothetical protein WD181_01720 [Solirubrobacterales bacterium]